MKRRFLSFFANFESFFCQFLLAFFICVIMLQIIFRFFAIAAPWTEELARFAFLWFVLFGACHATRLGVFNCVTMQFKGAPCWLRKICLLASDLFWLVFSLILAWEGALAALRLVVHPYFAPALDINLAWIYAAFPASFLLMAFRIIQSAWFRLRNGLPPMSDESRFEADEKRLLNRLPKRGHD